MEGVYKGIYIRLNPKRNRVLISKQCIAELGHPKKIRLLINPEKKLLAMQPCGNKEQIYFKVPKDLLSAGGKPFEICSQLLMTQIWSIMHWECMETYGINGVLSADKMAIFFDMQKAEIVTLNPNGDDDEQ